MHNTSFSSILTSILTPQQFFSSNSRIQDLDGGFFEKFGSLLRQKSEIAEEKISIPLAPLPEDESTVTDHLNTIEEGENDSGTETLQDTDSEHDEQDQSKKEEFLEDFTGWNVSHYSLSHNLYLYIKSVNCNSVYILVQIQTEQY